MSDMRTDPPLYYDTVPGAAGDAPSAFVVALPGPDGGPARQVVQAVLQAARRAGDPCPGGYLPARRRWVVAREHWRAVKAHLEAAGHVLKHRGHYGG
jgi:hypothetical protein